MVDEKRAIELEKKLGMNNISVIGGFAEYLQSINYDFVCSSSYSANEEANISKRFDSLPKFDSIKIDAFLDQPIESAKHVGSIMGKRFRRLGIDTFENLLYHFPHRYLNFAEIKKISQIKEGEEVTVFGKVVDIKKYKGQKGTRVLSVGIFDDTGYLYGTWFNQDYVVKKLREGMQVAFSGKVTYKYGLIQIQNPLYDILNEPDSSVGEDGWQKGVHTGRIIPIHPATQDLSPTLIRKVIKNLLDKFINISDYMPIEMRKKLKIPSLCFSLKEIHFPSTKNTLNLARKRLLFDELFLMQLALAFKKKRFEQSATGIKHIIRKEEIASFLNLLPFKLTKDQIRAIEEICKDMVSPLPMNRLLQGEVGSGKTIVALAALFASVKSGYQGAIMAPTEVLANQHFCKIKEILDKLKMVSVNLTGSLTSKRKKELQDEIKKGNIDVVVGTHALIQEGVEFNNLGLVVVDEQHRFGVEQRVRLKEKGVCPDFLIMTATPIPRTLSLTLYGDLDVSVIKERPGGRDLSDYVETFVCDNRHRKRAYEKIRDEIKNGRQAYVVCPLIEESDKLEAKAVMDEVVRLKKEIFPDFAVEVIHGKIKTANKEEIMKDFRAGKIDILISTTVIEVGIDVPNASVMLIENADRFGLSQLHQLRGRIGRGEHKSYCILFADLSTDESRARMKAIKNIQDGFKLAEADLQIRGEGQLFGTRQSGLPDLMLAKLTRDIDVLIQAREEAFAIIEKDPELALSIHKPLMRAVKRKFSKNLDWLFFS
ncbi:MAG TPA: ATP-dependent DNA helicase RecG [Actinobacteria bacterium]|nr:ATP-dependent DNA helicase RecG [Actinomycetota bacterium]